jgi:putative transposase
MTKPLSGKDKHLITDLIHCISKLIVKFAVENGVSVIGLKRINRNKG